MAITDKRLRRLESTLRGLGWLVFKPETMPDELTAIFTDEFLQEIVKPQTEGDFRERIAGMPRPSPATMAWCRRAVLFAAREFEAWGVPAWPDWGLLSFLALEIFGDSVMEVKA